jgi:16S rRNA (guanine527-N7)-methyltransferase
MTKRNYGPKEFAREFDVPDEACARLVRYVDLLERWNRRMNLVSRESVDDIWRRHIADSAQLAQLIPPYDGPLADVGSGAGFPGLVLAAFGFADVNLIESNGRKCAFLRESVRVIQQAQAQSGSTPGVIQKPALVHHLRLAGDVALPESLSRCSIITARAVSPLTNLLDIVSPLVYDGTCCVFPKGAKADDEIAAARRDWQFELERVASKMEPSGVILILRHVRRREKEDAGI